ncbi:hypothetical protein [Caballeronia sp. LZ032]|uniref:YncE family protein n=1 Tax=Caballeronia sp. LZ032 TaxID=3038565 RepID=UPI0028650D37|nr:hypothetical protein [Caballeronia sp. LZ032]MDR5877821.1 hypothetical protein [Caballeronia sp. LZ032]
MAARSPTPAPSGHPTPDGKYAFIANEWGKLTPTSDKGNIGIIALDKQRDGRTTGTQVGFIPIVGSGLAGVSFSPSGKRAFVPAEYVNATENETLSGTNNASLISTQCFKDSPQATGSNGALNVIDVAKAIQGAATSGSAPNVISNAVVTSVAAACSPVRAEATQDGSSVWITARGSNELLQFDRARLAVDPDHALLQSVGSNGLLPVGLYLDPVRPYLMVTNTNRWTRARRARRAGWLRPSTRWTFRSLISRRRTPGWFRRSRPGCFHARLPRSTAGEPNLSTISIPPQ